VYSAFAVIPPLHQHGNPSIKPAVFRCPVTAAFVLGKEGCENDIEGNPPVVSGFF
jgi:hypothetical protein